MSDPHDFQGFGEVFASPEETPRVPKEVHEEYNRMKKRFELIRTAISQRGKVVPYDLKVEEEVLRANLANFCARWGFTQ